MNPNNQTLTSTRVGSKIQIDVAEGNVHSPIKLRVISSGGDYIMGANDVDNLIRALRDARQIKYPEVTTCQGNGSIRSLEAPCNRCGEHHTFDGEANDWTEPDVIREALMKRQKSEAR